MAELESGLIERLERKYAGNDAVNVRQLAEDVGSARNPNALLTARCKAAARGEGMGLAVVRGETGPDHAGRFNADGTWVATGNVADYFGAPSGSITRFVRKLAYMRRNESLTPGEAAGLIQFHGFGDAFPNCDQWHGLEGVSGWLSARASTGAESSLRYAGIGSGFRHDLLEREPVAGHLTEKSPEQEGLW